MLFDVTNILTTESAAEAASQDKGEKKDKLKKNTAGLKIKTMNFRGCIKFIMSRCPGDEILFGQNH